MAPYIAEYRCQGCGHEYTLVQGDYGCPEGYVGFACGEDDPATCVVPGGCWGCSPCGRSRRRYRCSGCTQSTICPQCGDKWTKWLNYEALFGQRKGPST